MITIIGAGMGGLTLANILHKNGIDVVVHDADLSASSRYQGGMLNINQDGGQIALAKMGLLEAFRAIILKDGAAMRVLDKTATVRFDSGPQDFEETRPEVDRGALRQLLLASLPEGVVRWNAKVTGIARAGGAYQISFADGRREVGAVVIGADGAWSKVRPLLTDVTPVYSGISFVEMRVLSGCENHPVAARLVGQGAMAALSDNKALFGHRASNDEFCVYVGVRVAEDGPGQPLTREFLRAQFADWHEDFRTLLSAGDGELVARPIYVLPADLRWQRVSGVTLLGDAAHLMSPFAGEGVNLAMLDGAELAQAIIDHCGDIEAAFAVYEATMFARAGRAALMSAAGLEMAFAADAPRAMLEFFDGMR